MTLRHRLSLLVAIALVPPLLPTLYHVVRSQIVLDKEARDEALAAARLISAEFSQLIEGSRHLMTAMIKHPAVPGDEAACAAYFRAVHAHTARLARGRHLRPRSLRCFRPHPAPRQPGGEEPRLRARAADQRPLDGGAACL